MPAKKKQTEQLVFGGETLIVERKAIKNFYIRIDRESGHIRVTAPRRMSEAEIQRLLQKDWGWVEKKRSELAARPRLPVHHYREGEVFFLWGKPYILTVRERSQGKAAAYAKAGRLFLFVRPQDDAALRRQALETWYRSQLQAGIASLRAETEAIAGRRPQEYRIKKMKTRWGTCNVIAKRIWLNLSLAQYRPVILRYIMLHELTHLRVPNHGPAFHAYMDRFCPEWRQLKRELDNGPAYKI